MLIDNFLEGKLEVDKSWAYTDRKLYNTSHLTHNYYSYPAKFIPQIASRLILENSLEGDIIIDPFMGSGTTIVEAILNNRNVIGCDVNYIAYLVAKSKITAINDSLLQKEINQLKIDLEYRLNGKYEYYLKKSLKLIPQNERLDYWFKKPQKEILSVIFSRIQEIKNESVKNFINVAFSQILKSSSIWLQSSVKPQRDYNKKDNNVFELFMKRIKLMSKRNKDFFEIVNDKNNLENHIKADVYNCDARSIPCGDEIATLIVTSPPYVTSYEYADLHQLPSLWFDEINDLKSFRNKFIGSVFKTEENNIDVYSMTAKDIINKLGKSKKSKEIRKYYFEMYECFCEMKRVLKPNGKVCIVIGNTNYKNVEILNHIVFIEQFNNLGFELEHIIVRELTSKMLPSYRNPQTGRFSKSNYKNSKLVHPKEFIIILKKK